MNTFGSTMSKLSTSAGSYVLLGAVVLLTLFALPITNNFLGDTKQLVVLIASLLTALLYGLHIWTEKSFKITLSPFSAGLLWLGLGSVAAACLTNQYPYEALYDFGGVYLATAILAGLGSALLTKRSATLLPTVLGGSAAVLSITTILQYFGVGPSLLYNELLNIELPNTMLFNLAESPLIAFQYLSVALAGLVAYYFTAKHRNHLLILGMVVVLVVGLGFSLYSILPGRVASPVLPSFGATWSVALDVLQTPRTALLGVGPSSFVYAYNVFKPLWVNTTPAWAIEFSQGANVPLSLLITTGLVGFGAWLFLTYHLVRSFMKPDVRALPTTWMLVVLLVFQLIFPPHVGMLGLFGVVMAFWLAARAHDFEQVKLHTLITRISPKSDVPSTSATHFIVRVLAVALALASVLGVYAVGRAYAANNALYRAFTASQQGDVDSMYRLQQAAVQLNPFFDDYRRTLAVTNLNIALVLATNEKATEAEKAQALQFIQQAINEARSATILQPNDVHNWQVLAQVYRAITGNIEGTDAAQWALTAYTRAVETAPTDPNLRMEIGGMFYQQQKYQDAAQMFQQALQLKPDLMNAQYNLANSLRMGGFLGDAEAVYKQLLINLPANGEDFERVDLELKQTQAALATMSAKTTGKEVTPPLVNDSLGLTPQDLSKPQSTQAPVSELVEETDLNPPQGTESSSVLQ